MLEKIGLPPKPSLRGNNWVVDASHCQGCSSQFTFINRKHHCRRCGGLFCNSCSRERMFLRGQGDSPVRICEPCKKLEEAARFELRHGHKNRAGRGGSKLMTTNEDEVLNTILANDGKESVLSGRDSTMDVLSSVQRSKSSASSSNPQASQNEVGEIIRSFSVDVRHNTLTEIGSATPEELRQQALDEKKKHKILKAEGKSEEALRAFKRGKELERQAGALELQLRKNRKKALTSITMNEMPKNNLSPQMSKGKDDIGAELRELGWSDMDIQNADKKPASVSLEGELSNLLGEVSQKTNTQAGSLDKSQVMVHKKKALALKREGKLAEAKEELKRAKILEKQIEEHEFFVDDEDSDEEFSALIRSMDIDEQDVMSTKNLPNPSFNFDNLAGIADGLDDNFEVNDEDMDDPEIAAALESIGWTEDTNHPDDREALSNKIQSLKREALNEKRAGNTADAMVLLRRAKVLEKDLESCDSQETNLMGTNSEMGPKHLASPSAEISVSPKLAPKSKLMIQRELLAVKKKALALRREGKLDEADEELKKGKGLEQQLEEMDMASKPKVSNKHADNFAAIDVGDEEEDVTEQDMDDPSYLSLLKNLGWNDETSENVTVPPKENDSTSKQPIVSSSSQVHNGIQIGAPKRSKGEIQRELLGLKRKSLALRRQGETDEAEEVLKMARNLESQLAEMEAPNQESPPEFNKQNKNEVIKIPLKEDIEVVREKREEIVGASPSKRSKGEIQRELLNLKRKSLALRRQGEIDEAEEILVTTRHLETELAEMESPYQEINNLNEDQVTTFPLEEDNEKREETVRVSEKQNINEPNSLQQEILAHKRKAITLKREGKLAEAKEELRQAKILEKNMENPIHSPEPSTTPQVTKTDQTSISPPKLSSRDRFKLQQQSLAHKRTALKLRREGRMDEAEAEFELAKALETQLDEFAAQDSTKSSVDDVGVEDFLDPQLLSALKAIGLDDGSTLSVKSIAGNVESSSGERIQIEEQIKAEKVSAVRLKRLGKQGEALDALRKAKLLEKKLNSLAS